MQTQIAFYDCFYFYVQPVYFTAIISEKFRMRKYHFREFPLQILTEVNWIKSELTERKQGATKRGWRGCDEAQNNERLKERRLTRKTGQVMPRPCVELVPQLRVIIGWLFWATSHPLRPLFVPHPVIISISLSFHSLCMLAWRRVFQI